MIKLNNKNITYVALADSSNSLKAPKEIWYADSSNSVKLVYRRKDALIEGEDYEKYHWLQGRNGAYINTEHLVKTYEDVFEVYAKYDGTNRNPDGGEQNPFGIQDDNIRLASYIAGDNAINAVIKQNESTWNHDIRIHKDIFLITLYATNSSEYVKILDGVSYTNPIGGTVTNDTNLKMYIFARNGKANSYFQGDIAYFRITDHTFTTDKLHFIPCKLLKPVPKWLDANGIRRQVGECGMIDLVSGKFYGNVNSVGTFTVENYYERKEWLVGDGSAYIDTNIIVDVPSLYISTSFTKKVNVEITSPLFGSRDTINSNGSQIFYQNGKLRFDIITNGANWIIVDSSDIQNINQLIVDCPNKVININEITLSSGVDDLSIKNSSNTFKIYSLELLNASDGNSVPYNGSFGNFTLNDSTHSLNLIPCTLTMDLPASMDANNIARTKGTSGMWDLVSDKFYGNVANSGTFKAVNLAEGVDYEVHHWLKGDGSAYIDTLISDLTNVNDVICYFSSKGVLVDNRIFGREMSGSWFTVGADMNNNSRLSVWIGNSLQYPSIDPNEDFIEIDLINNIARTSLQSYNFNAPASIGRTFYLFGNNGYNIPFVGKIKQFTIGDILNLIPCKLLRSIPAKYDANGIARQVGECGMYDTVNDVFYGNVASSGSFTVEDDN